jgi:hypothetical protein
MKLLLTSFLSVSLLAACGGSKTPAVVGQVASGALPAGHYGCRITQSDFAYPFYACDVTADGGALMLEKIEGQMRLKGTVTLAADGSLAFTGDLWCTWDESCKGAVAGTLAVVDGGWEGVLPEHAMADGQMMPALTFTLMRESVLESAGGKRYGGYGDGGWENVATPTVGE